jgi:hypothetical protein
MDPESLDPSCSQSAACLSSMTQTDGDRSTEGGGLGTDDRASGIASGLSRREDMRAGGTASEPESSGTGKVARDRRGLADAWPMVRPFTDASPVPDSLMALVGAS